MYHGRYTLDVWVLKGLTDEHSPTDVDVPEFSGKTGHNENHRIFDERHPRIEGKRKRGISLKVKLLLGFRGN